MLKDSYRNERVIVEVVIRKESEERISLGIGVNFICNDCHYDTGILMLNQGFSKPLKNIIRKYVYMYSHEFDHKMLPSRATRYQAILTALKEKPHLEATYNYYGCICYNCARTYEMLDILQQKEEEVFAGEKLKRAGMDSAQEIFHFSNGRWSSLIGENPSCLFCDDTVVKISEEKLHTGLQCPKCHVGTIKLGEEFQLWE